MNEIFKEASELSELLQLPKEFNDNLLKEDDWSFIIKLSALFEAASGQALSAKLQHPEIESELSYLEQANSKCGKITFMLKLNIINKDQSFFLKKLAELRNKLVHNINQISFDCESYISSLDANQKKEFVRAFGHGINETFDVNEQQITRKDFTLMNPTLAIWMTANETLACLNLDIKMSVDKKEFNETIRLLGKKILIHQITKDNTE